MEIELHNDNGSSILLDENTLLFVLDETGHEEFKDPSYEIFGIGGCAFNVKDYQRLIEIPFNFMCKKYFPEVVRPWHTADIIKNWISKLQIEALNHFFEKFQFFRIAHLASKNVVNSTNLKPVEFVINSLMLWIKKIAENATFDSIFLLTEHSDRLSDVFIKKLSQCRIKRWEKEISIGVWSLPKKTIMVALEVADLIIHTAGRQVRHRKKWENSFLLDFESIFKKVDLRLVEFKEILNVEKTDI